MVVSVNSILSLYSLFRSLKFKISALHSQCSLYISHVEPQIHTSSSSVKTPTLHLFTASEVPRIQVTGSHSKPVSHQSVLISHQAPLVEHQNCTTHMDLTADCSQTQFHSAKVQGKVQQEQFFKHAENVEVPININSKVSKFSEILHSENPENKIDEVNFSRSRLARLLKQPRVAP